jgi:hypothetical protein
MDEIDTRSELFGRKHVHEHYHDGSIEGGGVGKGEWERGEHECVFAGGGKANHVVKKE